MKSISRIFLMSLCSFVFISCGSGGSDDGGSDSSAKLDFETQCGAVQKASLKNPVSASTEVTVVNVISSNLIAVRPLGATGGDFLVKLHAIAESQVGSQRAIDVLKSLSAGTVYYVPADETCTVTVPGGGTAFTGQLFTAGGKSFTEELILSGYSGAAETAGACHEQLIGTCYAPLVETHRIKSAGDITDFLWKPRAESPYNPGNPVIHANPCDATVHVNGQPLLDFGPGNGRCNTSRMFSSCGSFGSNIRVEIFDNKTGLPYFNGNDPYVIVPNGCSRYEFKR